MRAHWFEWREGEIEAAREGAFQVLDSPACEGALTPDQLCSFTVVLVGAFGPPVLGTFAVGLGFEVEGGLASVSIPRAFFMFFLIVLVTTVASMRHTIAAVRHRVCQAQEQNGRKVGLLCSSTATCPPKPVGAGGGGCGQPPVSLRPTTTFLMSALLAAAAHLSFLEKGIWEMGFSASDDFV